MSRRFNIAGADVDECRAEIDRLCYGAINGTHPHAHNMIGMILRRLEEVAGAEAAESAIEEYDLNDLGIYA